MESVGVKEHGMHGEKRQEPFGSAQGIAWVVHLLLPLIGLDLSEYSRGARCDSSARRDLCGGRRVTGGSTVTAKKFVQLSFFLIKQYFYLTT